MYIMDEPTSGLHFADIEQLLHFLIKLRNAGNTLVIIEHQLDVIKCADYVIDLGPEGGEGGGQVVAKGTPEFIAEQPASHTGKFLKKVLESRAASIRALQSPEAFRTGPYAEAQDRCSDRPRCGLPVISSGLSARTTFAGVPITSDPGGTRISFVTSACAPTDAAFADHRAVKNRRAHSDQAFVLHRAGVQDRAMADRHQLADAHRQIIREMHEASVPWMFEPSPISIKLMSPRRTAVGQTLLRAASRNITDHDGLWCHICSRVDLRLNVRKRARWV